uniref:G-protein coupled receptors family 1 profile domain-containing protein n=1 Tax=Anopheles atroparvus TaxID=41427 RepID=A0A182J901_ANOAO
MISHALQHAVQLNRTLHADPSAMPAVTEGGGSGGNGTAMNGSLLLPNSSQPLPGGSNLNLTNESTQSDPTRSNLGLPSLLNLGFPSLSSLGLPSRSSLGHPSGNSLGVPSSEVYAPNYPYVSSTEQQSYIEQLADVLHNQSAAGGNGSYGGAYDGGYSDYGFEQECSNAYSAGTYFQMTSYFMYITIFVIAVIGNSIVLFIVQSNPRMRTVTNFFITNLAVGDLMMTLFCVPFTFISLFILQYWPFGLAMCRLVNYTQAVSVLVSAYTLVAISGDRYIAIMWPLRPRITKTFSKCLIGVVWIIALITAAPIAIFSTLYFPTKWHVQCNVPICAEMWPSPEQDGYYTVALLTTQFVIPLVVLIFTYTRIAIVVWGKRPPGEAENSRDQRMAKSKRKHVHIFDSITTPPPSIILGVGSGMILARH